MAILKCKMCGGDLNITAEEKIIECEYCGSTQTIPEGNDEKKTNLFNRANRLRMDNEFDKAAGVYESIVSEFPEEAEGYWGLVLCSYGIEYVDDAKTGKKIPTCHRTLTSSVMDDDNFVQACENADVVARGIYREEAKAIDKLQQKIIAVVENEEPYDVFICYKETDDITKSRTEDSLIVQDIYTELIKEGYKVFFSRVTLRDKAGTEYEPYIYAALKSAKIMLAIGTKFDYYDAVWVKNEWSRYISMMADDSSKHLIPCFKNLDAYDIPKEFKNLQALDMGEVTFFKNLTDNVERIIPKQTTEQPKVVEIQSDSNSATVDSLLKRAFMFLEEGSWDKADEYCEKVLDINPECAEAYLYKFFSSKKISNINEIIKIIIVIDEPYYECTLSSWEKLSTFEFDAMRRVGQEKAKKLVEDARIDIVKAQTGCRYDEAKSLIENLPIKINLTKSAIKRLKVLGASVSEIGKVVENYIPSLEDSNLKNFFKFANADEGANLKNIIDDFKKKAESIAKQKRLEEKQRIRNLSQEKFYQQGIKLIDENNVISLNRAISLFKNIIDYNDSQTKLESCYKKLDVLEEKRILSFFEQLDEPLSAIEIRESARPKISKPQSRLEKMAQSNIVEIINDGNVTKYCLGGYENRKRIKEIDSEIKKLEIDHQEKIQEETEAEEIQDKIKKLTERKNALSIFGIKEKKQIQAEIDVLSLKFSELENVIKIKRSEIDTKYQEQIDILSEEKEKIKKSQK